MADDTVFFDITQVTFARLNANFSALPIVFENSEEDFGDTLASGFVTATLLLDSSIFSSINGPNPRIRTTGALAVDVLTPLNEGVGAGLNYAGDIAQIFRGQQFSGMLFFAPVVASGRKVTGKHGNFWNTPLICPFQHETSVSV